MPDTETKGKTDQLSSKSDPATQDTPIRNSHAETTQTPHNDVKLTDSVSETVTTKIQIKTEKVDCTETLKMKDDEKKLSKNDENYQVKEISISEKVVENDKGKGRSSGPKSRTYKCRPIMSKKRLTLLQKVRYFFVIKSITIVCILHATVFVELN